MATLLVILVAFAGGYFAGAHGSPASVSGHPGSFDNHIACYFSPNGGCTSAIIDQIAAARHSIEVQGYALTSHAIGEALIAAHRRGVEVTIVLDAAQASEHRDEPRELLRAQIPIYFDARHALADDRIILIDNRVVITGGFNFTDAAESENAETLLIIRDQPRLQTAFEDNFHAHLVHSQRYDGTRVY